MEVCRLSSDAWFLWMESRASRNSSVQSMVLCCRAIRSYCIISHISLIGVDSRASPVLTVGWTSSLFLAVISIEVGVREF